MKTVSTDKADRSCCHEIQHGLICCLHLFWIDTKLGDP